MVYVRTQLKSVSNENKEGEVVSRGEAERREELARRLEVAIYNLARGESTGAFYKARVHRVKTALTGAKMDVRNSLYRPKKLPTTKT